jgi:hypothetical protein
LRPLRRNTDIWITPYDTVYLVNGYREIETPHGRGVSIEDVKGLHMAISHALVDEKLPELGRQIDAAEVHEPRTLFCWHAAQSLLMEQQTGRTSRTGTSDVTRPPVDIPVAKQSDSGRGPRLFQVPRSETPASRPFAEIT